MLSLLLSRDELLQLSLLMILNKLLYYVEGHHEFYSSLGSCLSSLASLEELLNDVNVSEDIELLVFNHCPKETAQEVVGVLE